MEREATARVGLGNFSTATAPSLEARADRLAFEGQYPTERAGGVGGIGPAIRGLPEHIQMVGTAPSGGKVVGLVCRPRFHPLC
jgi:hypothetical protein